jgi:TonB family protein
MRNAMKTTTTILTLLLLTSFSGRLFACSCKGQKSVEEEIKYSDAVFTGTILSKELVKVGDSSKNFTTVARYYLLVQDFYKGETTSDTLVIFTGLGSADCGVIFDVSQKYIVYGKSEPYFHFNFEYPKGHNIFWTNSCLRTTSYFQEEIIEIEKFAKKQQLHSDVNDTIIFSDPDVPPIFKNGGDTGLKKFIQENLRYPKTGECVTGRVYVGFTVDTLGNVKDIEIKRGITTSTDEEAIRVVRMLTFIPGTRFGRPIETKMVLPISFTIEYKDDK